MAFLSSPNSGVVYLSLFSSTKIWICERFALVAEVIPHAGSWYVSQIQNTKNQILYFRVHTKGESLVHFAGRDACYNMYGRITRKILQSKKREAKTPPSFVLSPAQAEGGRVGGQVVRVVARAQHAPCTSQSGAASFLALALAFLDLRKLVGARTCSWGPRGSARWRRRSSVRACTWHSGSRVLRQLRAAPCPRAARAPGMGAPGIAWQPTLPL